MNLFAYRAKDSKNLVKVARKQGYEYIIGDKNYDNLKDYISKSNKIIIAWGENASGYKSQYDNRIRNVMKFLKNRDGCYVGKHLGKYGYTLHGQVWRYSMPQINVK